MIDVDDFVFDIQQVCNQLRLLETKLEKMESKIKNANEHWHHYFACIQSHTADSIWCCVHTIKKLTDGEEE